MNVEDFLRRYPPFDGLTPERLAKLARSIEIAHVPVGEVILRQGGTPAAVLHVVRKGAVELVGDDVVLDLLGEGEVFGQFSLLAHESPTATVRAHEDTLLYLIPEPDATAILGSDAGLTFVLGSFRQRLRSSADARAGGSDPGYRHVGALVRRPPVTAAPDTPVADAARLMADERVSCLLLETPDGWAIVTDRDLREKVVATRGSFERPVRDVATLPVTTIDVGTLAGDALITMLERGVHHLPVVDAGRPVGVVTDTDLMGIGRHTPFAIKSAIGRARTRDDLVAAVHDLPEVVAALVGSHTDPFDVGRVTTLVLDEVTDRLVDLAVSALGDPPAPYAWLALGSAARHEQALRTDQDHALAYAAPHGAIPEDVDPYFAALAEEVTAGLEAAGIPRCRGEAMAVHPGMRRSVDGWEARFRAWMDEPDVDTSILSSIGFDFRRQSGPLDPEARLDAAVRDARSHPAFLKMLGRRALALKPPTGFVRDLVVEHRGEHAGRLDVKHGGITIVTNLARAWGISAGASAKPTRERLEAATAAGLVEPALASELGDAFHFLWDVRLQHHAAQIRELAAPDDFVDPSTLSAFQRSGLKEAFRVVRHAQRVLAGQLGVELH